MTRRKWTTDEQEEWLDERKADFMEANQRKAAAKDFFPTVCRDFRTKWPVPSVTEGEIKEAAQLSSPRSRNEKPVTRYVFIVTDERKSNRNILSVYAVGFTIK